MAYQLRKWLCYLVPEDTTFKTTCQPPLEKESNSLFEPRAITFNFPPCIQIKLSERKHMNFFYQQRSTLFRFNFSKRGVRIDGNIQKKNQTFLKESCYDEFNLFIMSIKLSFSQGFLKDKDKVNRLINLLATSNKQFLIDCKQSQQTSIQCAKIKLFSTSKSIACLQTIKIWVAEETLSSVLMDPLSSHIIIGQIGLKNSNIERRQVLKVSTVQSLKGIFDLSLFQFEKQCIMQKTAQKYQKEYYFNKSREKIYQMASKYLVSKNNKSLINFLVFLRFNTKWYINRIRRCFNIWRIYHIQTTMEQTNELIIRTQYFVCLSNKKLTSKCFQNWKRLIKRK